MESGVLTPVWELTDSEGRCQQAWHAHIEYLGHLGEVEVSLVSVEALQLGRILILALFRHVVSQVSLLLSLSSGMARWRSRSSTSHVATLQLSQACHKLHPIHTFSTSALVALMS